MDVKENKHSKDTQSEEMQSLTKKTPNALFWVIFLVAAVFIADVASKSWVMSHLSFQDVWPITGFFNLVLTVNHGVSFSMFTAHHMYGVYALIGLTSMLTFLVLYFIFTSQTLFEKLAFSLIFSGAIGNLFDRIRIQGVVDFLDFHIAGYHWPAFNVADTAICIGVGLLFIYYFLLQKKKEQ